MKVLEVAKKLVLADDSDGDYALPKVCTAVCYVAKGSHIHRTET